MYNTIFFSFLCILLLLLFLMIAPKGGGVAQAQGLVGLTPQPALHILFALVLTHRVA